MYWAQQAAENNVNAGWWVTKSANNTVLRPFRANQSVTAPDCDVGTKLALHYDMPSRHLPELCVMHAHAPEKVGPLTQTTR